MTTRTEPSTASLEPTPQRVADGRLESHDRKRFGISELYAVFLVTALGFIVRAVHVLSADFPVNDGGLFFAMTHDLLRSGLAIPAVTSYNAVEIPFAYPPLPFYAAAAFQFVNGGDLIQAFRYLPLAVSVLTIPAFYGLGRRVLPTHQAAIIATIAFTLIPRSFNWQITGGGLTRGLGLLFAILAIQFTYATFRESRWRHAILTTIFSALTVLSHPEMAWFVAITAAVFYLALPKRPMILVQSVAIAGGVTALSAPWLVTVVTMHGLAPFLSAIQAGGHSIETWMYPFVVGFTDEPFHGILAMLAILGACACLVERKWLLPLWFIALYVLDPRKAATNATLPEALLASYAITVVLLPRLYAVAPNRNQAPQTDTHVRSVEAPGWRTGQSKAVTALLIGGLVYATLSAIAAPFERSSPLRSLTRDDLAALQWVAANTPAGSRFAVMAIDRQDVPSWGTDRLSEWFPVLAQRQSVATVQGFEWLGRDSLKARVDAYRRLQLCGERGAACLSEYAHDADAAFTHVYIPRNEESDWRFTDCCSALRHDLAGSPEYRLVYEGKAAMVFAKNPVR